MKKIDSKTFNEPSWELSMARKDARLMMEDAERTGKKLLTIPPIAAKMDEWLGRGHAKDDWTILSQN